MEVFWAGLIGAVVGAAAGAYQRRTYPNRAAPVAAGVAVLTFAIVSAAIAALG